MRKIPHCNRSLHVTKLFIVNHSLPGARIDRLPLWYALKENYTLFVCICQYERGCFRMKKRKSGNSFERLKEICQKHGVQFSNQPSNSFIIIDENGIEHIVDKHFNLFV